MQTVPEKLGMVVELAGKLRDAKREAESRDISAEERLSGKAGGYGYYCGFLNLLSDALSAAADGAAIWIAPNVVAFLIPLLVPFEDWPG